jgi:hypothetical protein
MQSGSSEKLSSPGGRAPCGFPMSVLDQADNPRRLVPHHDDSSVSSSACPYSTLLGGIRCWVHRDRHSLPLHSIEGQSPLWGACVTRASRGEEWHLYDTQVIKDLFDLSPSSLTQASFRGNGSQFGHVAGFPNLGLLWRLFSAAHAPCPYQSALRQWVAEIPVAP